MTVAGEPVPTEDEHGLGGAVTIARKPLSRRSFLLGAAGTAALGLWGCSDEDDGARTDVAERRGPAECPALEQSDGSREPLWETAFANGIVYGSSAATWQLADPQYRRLFGREAAILFTEDDLLWYRLKPTPQAELDFKYGDRIVRYAENNGMLVLGAHLVWDEGFGEGWTDDDLWGINAGRARHLIYDTIESVVGRYRGRVSAWIVANEVLDGSGLRSDVPWYNTIGPAYVGESFRIANEADPDAVLLLNDFGYETDDDFARADSKRAATLELLDQLLAGDVPVHALGVQAHLQADDFAENFDAAAYGQFLSEVADRGLKILVTELDVLDDGLSRRVGPRDRAIADVIARYLDAALAEPAVSSLITFGLSDRYTWLEEDFPRSDGSPRRPLPFDERLKPKPWFEALAGGLEEAPEREQVWVPPRC